VYFYWSSGVKIRIVAARQMFGNGEDKRQVRIFERRLGVGGLLADPARPLAKKKVYYC
jgi:hypothetical protein